MAKEIERRFLVDKLKVLQLISETIPLRISQGYFDTAAGEVARIRVIDYCEDQSAVVTFKFPATSDEYEYPISAFDALEMLQKLKFKVTKNRYVIPHHDGLKFEIDAFDDSPFIIAEIEVPYMDFTVDIPDWCVKEITGVSGVSNFDMAKNIYMVGLKLREVSGA